MRIVLVQHAHPVAGTFVAKWNRHGLADPAVEAQGLIKRYPKGVTALDGLTFSIQRGSIFSLLGANGAGKSSTVRILCTLLRADAGSASICGCDVVREPRQVRQLIGCVAQGASSDLDATGRENLLLQGRLHGLGGRSLRARVDDLLEQFGLTSVANRMVRTYSVGMERKLDIAIGMVHHPKVLFLDEPTSGLDPQARAELWKLLRSLCSKEDLTILLTTHYLEEADRVADRIAFINHGRIVASGTARELKSSMSEPAIEIGVDELGLEDQLHYLLSRIANVRNVEIQGSSVIADSDEGMGTLAVILSTLADAGFRVSSIKSIDATLDDVYFCHAGSHCISSWSR